MQMVGRVVCVLYTGRSYGRRLYLDNGMSAPNRYLGFQLGITTEPVRQHRKIAKLYFNVFAVCAVLSLLAVQIAPAKPTLGYRVIGMACAGGMSVAITMLIYHATLAFKALLKRNG